MTPEDSQFVANIRLRIVQNRQAGNQPEAGLSREELARALGIVRSQRTLPAPSKTRAKAAQKAVDMGNLLGNLGLE